MILPTIIKELPYLFSLMFGKLEKRASTPDRCMPMVDAQTRERILWSIVADVSEHTDSACSDEVPSLYQLAVPAEVGAGERDMD